MKTLSLLLVATLILLLCACIKDPLNKTYSIKGKLLECSSNPIPVGNYELRIYQLSDYGLFGGVQGIDQSFKTDGSGNFQMTYIPYKSTGLITGGINLNTLTISGVDTLNYKGLYPNWSPVSANKDTNFNTIFLYKKIETLVRKIQFNTSLGINDSIEVITNSAYRSKYKWVKGPITAGTLLVVDTIKDQLSERYNMNIRGYYFSSVLKKPFFQTNFHSVLNSGDEIYREVILIY